MTTTKNKHYFSSLEGKTIKSVVTLGKGDIADFGWDWVSPEETTVLIFTDGTAAVITADPEGNGPGWIETGDVA